MMILAVWFSTCHMAIYTIFTGHGVWWWRFIRRRWEEGERVGSRAGISTHHPFIPQICSQDDHHHQSWGEYQSALFLLLGHFQLWDFPSQVRCQHFPQDMSVLSWLVIVIAFSSTKEMSWKQQTEMNWSMKFWFVLHLKWSGWEKSTNW